MCTCRGRHLCPYHEELRQEYVQIRRRMQRAKVHATGITIEARLTALARDFELSIDQWCKLMYLYEEDDLHRLLFQAGAS